MISTLDKEIYNSLPEWTEEEFDDFFDKNKGPGQSINTATQREPSVGPHVHVVLFHNNEPVARKKSRFDEFKQLPSWTLQQANYYFTQIEKKRSYSRRSLDGYWNTVKGYCKDNNPLTPIAICATEEQEELFKKDMEVTLGLVPEPTEPPEATPEVIAANTKYIEENILKTQDQHYDPTTQEESKWLEYILHLDEGYMRNLEQACWNLFHYQIDKSTEVGPHGWNLSGATAFWDAANKRGLMLNAGGFTEWRHYSGRGYDASIKLAKDIIKEGKPWGKDLLEAMEALRDSGSKSSYNPKISFKMPDVKIYHTDADDSVLVVDINYPYAKALWDTYHLSLYKYVAVGTDNYWDELKKGRVAKISCNPKDTINLTGKGLKPYEGLVAYLEWKNGRHKWGTPSGGSKPIYPWGKPGEEVSESTAKEIREAVKRLPEKLFRNALKQAKAEGHKGTTWHRALVTLGYEVDASVTPFTIEEVVEKVALWQKRQTQGDPMAKERLYLWRMLRDEMTVKAKGNG